MQRFNEKYQDCAVVGCLMLAMNNQFLNTLNDRGYLTQVTPLPSTTLGRSVRSGPLEKTCAPRSGSWAQTRYPFRGMGSQILGSTASSAYIYWMEAGRRLLGEASATDFSGTGYQIVFCGVHAATYQRSCSNEWLRLRC